MKQISYESSRDLPTEIAYATGTGTLLAKRNYTYDTLGRVAARTQTRGTETPRNDSFGYNTRSELTSATLGSDNYAYAFDNIGNRQTASESGTTSSYTTNNLNQYQAIISGEATLLSLLGEPSSGNSSTTYFTPLHDADGNAVLIRTSTGVWQITYKSPTTTPTASCASRTRLREPSLFVESEFEVLSAGSEQVSHFRFSDSTSFKNPILSLLGQ